MPQHGLLDRGITTGERQQQCSACFPGLPDQLSYELHDLYGSNRLLSWSLQFGVTDFSTWWRGQDQVVRPADRPAHQGFAVARTPPARRPVREEVAAMAAAPVDQQLHGVAHGAAKRVTSPGVSEPAGRPGSRPHRHKTSSAIRFPMPATRG